MEGEATPGLLPLSGSREGVAMDDDDDEVAAAIPDSPIADEDKAKADASRASFNDHKGVDWLGCTWKELVTARPDLKHVTFGAPPATARKDASGWQFVMPYVKVDGQDFKAICCCPTGEGGSRGRKCSGRAPLTRRVVPRGRGQIQQ